MTDCLIISADAHEFEEEITRLADRPMAVKACTCAKQALTAYSDESIVFGSPGMIAEILEQMPTVDWVQSSWAGVSPLVTLKRRDYVLTVIKGVFGPQMSEYVLAYLLAHELKLSQRLEKQREHQWFDAGSGSLQGKRLGIMGTGSIGRHIAKTAKAFDLMVTGLSRSGAPVPGFEKVLPVSQLHRFLEGIDYLVAALPHTADTNNLLNAAALAKLPSHAYLVNVGRGNVVDEGALIDALKNGRLAGAALDVFDQEPIPENSPLWDTPKLSITAHVAAMSHPSLIVPIFLENHHRYMEGQALEHVFDFDAGY